MRNRSYSVELAQEHKDWTQEIYQLIKEGYPEWERRRNEIQRQQGNLGYELP